MDERGCSVFLSSVFCLFADRRYSFGAHTTLLLASSCMQDV